jgi:hypothetical protein
MKIDSLPEAVLSAQLLLLPPAQVFAYLQSRVRPAADGADGTRERDSALLKRGEPLIQLGLASFSGAPHIVRHIWLSVPAPLPNAASPVNSALRVACLSNRCVPDHHFHSMALVREEWLSIDEAERIIEGDYFEEVRALLQNPRFPKLVSIALQRSHFFASMHSERWLACLGLVAKNPLLSGEGVDGNAADLYADERKKAILHLAQSLSPSESAMAALDALLRATTRERAAQSNDVEALLNRWAVEQFPEDERGMIAAHAQDDGGIDDFRCRLAAALTNTHEWSDTKIDTLRTSDDAARVAAFFANAPLRLNGLEAQMRAGQRAAQIGAMMNPSLMLNDEARRVIESSLSPDLREEYQTLCERLAQRYSYFRKTLPTETVRNEPAAGRTLDVDELMHRLAMMNARLDEQSHKMSTLRIVMMLAVLLGLAVYLLQRFG